MSEERKRRKEKQNKFIGWSFSHEVTTGILHYFIHKVRLRPYCYYSNNCALETIALIFLVYGQMHLLGETD